MDAVYNNPNCYSWYYLRHIIQYDANMQHPSRKYHSSIVSILGSGVSLTICEHLGNYTNIKNCITIRYVHQMVSIMLLPLNINYVLIVNWLKQDKVAKSTLTYYQHKKYLWNYYYKVEGTNLKIWILVLASLFGKLNISRYHTIQRWLRLVMVVNITIWLVLITIWTWVDTFIQIESSLF